MATWLYAQFNDVTIPHVQNSLAQFVLPADSLGTKLETELPGVTPIPRNVRQITFRTTPPCQSHTIIEQLINIKNMLV